MKNNKLFTLFLLTLLLCCITLISCGNSETGGGDTSALSPIDTTVTIPETADDTTSPEQTTVSPETTSTPETTALPESNSTETPDVTEITPTEETTTPETTAPQSVASIGAINAKDITSQLSLFVTPLEFSGNFSGNGEKIPYRKIIKTEKEFNEIYWAQLDMNLTSDIYPLSLNELFKKYDENFFEDNYLVFDCYYNTIDKKTDSIIYACIDDNNTLYIFPNLKKFREGDFRGEYHNWIYFVEIPKHLINENTPSEVSVSWETPSSIPLFAFEETLYTLGDILDKKTTPIEKMCETENFKKYLLICRENLKQFYGSEDIEDILKIDEILKHCK
ncbi:MAG: hypothetical protein E7615_00025 [Ruminococcaceae bacterium]|nr:hypothetical protein [Oscillospiraceae bacterium]